MEFQQSAPQNPAYASQPFQPSAPAGYAPQNAAYESQPVQPSFPTVFAPQNSTNITMPVVQPSSSTVIIQPNQPTDCAMNLGPNSCRVKCRSCNSYVTTRTKSTASRNAHFCCLVLFFTACWCYSCLPYCLDSMKNIHHYCPNCKAYIGFYMP